MTDGSHRYGTPIPELVYRRLQELAANTGALARGESGHIFESLTKCFIDLREHFQKYGLPYYFGELPEGVPDPRVPITLTEADEAEVQRLADELLDTTYIGSKTLRERMDEIDSTANVREENSDTAQACCTPQGDCPECGCTIPDCPDRADRDHRQ